MHNIRPVNTDCFGADVEARGYPLAFLFIDHLWYYTKIYLTLTILLFVIMTGRSWIKYIDQTSSLNTLEEKEIKRCALGLLWTRKIATKDTDMMENIC